MKFLRPSLWVLRASPASTSFCSPANGPHVGGASTSQSGGGERSAGMDIIYPPR